MSLAQNLDDIEIPVIEIVPGWDATTLDTVDDCDDAQIKVGAIIAEIEFQIDMFEALPDSKRDYEWLARAKKALRFKKIALQCVNNCRARLNKAEKTHTQQLEERVKRLEILAGVLRQDGLAKAEG